MSAARPARLALFGATAVLVWAACLAIARSPAFAAHADAIAPALTFDLTLTVPLAFYLLLVRPRLVPALSLAVVFVASVGLAHAVIPAGHGGTLQVMEVLAGLAEVTLVGLVATRAVRSFGRLGGRARETDVLEALRQTAADIVGDNRAADVLAAELGIWALAVGGFRSPPPVPEGAQVFTIHRKSGWIAVAWSLCLVIAIETAAIHFLVARWSTLAAWLATLSSLYAIVFLVADAQAMRRLPILLTADALWVRIGIRRRARVPRAAIGRVEHVRQRLKGPDLLDGVVLGTPQLLLHLSSPVEMRGLYGTRRQVTRIQLQVDDAERLAAELGTALPAPVATAAT